jgi:hypothetical protein
MDKINLLSPLWWIKQFTFFFDSGGDAPTPDPAIGLAALKNAKLGEDAFNFYKTEYEAAKPANAAQHDLAMKVQQQLLDSSTQNAAYAKEYQDYWKGTFQPLEKNIVEDAKNWDSAGRREQEAAKGVSDVRQAFDTQKAITARNNERMGVNPNSGNAAAMNQQNDVSEAVASASAANAGRTKAELTGHAMEMDAASLGRNLPSNQVASANVANSAGLNAVGVGSNDLANGRAGLATMGAGYNAAMAGNTSQANILNNQYQNQLAGYKAQQDANSAMWGGIGSLAGVAIGMYADGGEVDASKIGEVVPLEKGNIDLAKRPLVKNKDGSISTVRSIGVNIDGIEMLLPTVSDDGRIMSDDEAVATYKKTGKHLGKFKSPEDSDRYGEALHVQQQKFYGLKNGGAVDPSKYGLSEMDEEAAEGDTIDDETSEVFSGSGGVKGAGTATSDSIPARLSDGEFVLNEGAVKMIGLDALDAINKRGLKFRTEGVRKNGN